MRNAAFFDLDRTLVGDGSGPIFSQALREVGLMPDRDNPVSDALFSIFRATGENKLTMELTRRLSVFAKGWPLDKVHAAAEIAGIELAALVQPYARQLVEEHREAGTLLVIATTSPQQFVEPLGRLLGFDAVIGTKLGETDGALDGTVDGPFVWHRGKLDAVTAWAAENDVSVAKSHAYSDSWYDAPLLAAVGRATAVNPDPRLTGLALLQGWPIRHLDKPPGVVKVGPLEIQEWIRPFLNPALIPYAKFELHGTEHLPADGPAIVCGNHRSYFDIMAMSVTLASRNRPGRFLGKKEVFDAPVVGQLASALGGIRVDRGSGSGEPLTAAARALEAGDVVAIMPEGTIPRGPAFFDPVLKGRPGAARLAALTKAPVIPVGLWGTEAVWPRNQRLPTIDVARPPSISVVIGPPVELTYDDPVADTATIMEAIADLLPDEAREPHDPTPEQLARTYPPGFVVPDVEDPTAAPTD